MNWHKRSIFDDYRSVITKWCYVQVLWIMSTYTYLFYLSIFDSYSSQAQWILLRRRRAEVEAEVNSCFSVIANNCFRIIAQVLPNSVVHSFCFWNHSVTIILITYIEISSQFPLEFNRFIQFNQQELHIFLLKNVTLHSLSSLVLFKVVFSSIAFFTRYVTLTKRARSIHFEIKYPCYNHLVRDDYYSEKWRNSWPIRAHTSL